MDDQLFQPPQVSQMPPAQKYFTSKLIWIIVGLLILGGVVYGGFWFWNDKNKESVAPTFTPRVIDETEGWQTYRNDKYSFEFKYPDNLNYGSPPNYPDTVFFDKGIISFPENADGPLRPLVLSVKSNTTVQQEIETYKAAYEYKDFKQSTLSVGNVTATRISGIVNALSYVEGKFNVEVFTYVNGRIIQLSYIGDLDLNVDTFNQILSTFKFIDSTAHVTISLCDEISDSSFVSVGQHEIGLGPDGPVMGSWNITFDVAGLASVPEKGKVSWHHSDVVETGTYSCSGDKITVVFPGSGSIGATYDAAKDILSWQGEKYVKVETSETVCPTPQYTSPHCPKILTKAKNIKTGEIKEFPDGCLPQCWVEIQ